MKEKLCKKIWMTPWIKQDQCQCLKNVNELLKENVLQCSFPILEIIKGWFSYVRSCLNPQVQASMNGDLQ